MKTSVIEVHDLLSVLSLDDLEERIGEVPGVESVTANFAAGNATVRYDETRLDITHLKSAVRQRGYDHAVPDPAPMTDRHKDHGAPSTSAEPVVQKSNPVSPITAGVDPPAIPSASATKTQVVPETATPKPNQNADPDEHKGSAAPKKG